MSCLKLPESETRRQKDILPDNIFFFFFCALDIPSRIIAVAKKTNQTWWNTCKLILVCLIDSLCVYV